MAHTFRRMHVFGAEGTRSPGFSEEDPRYKPELLTETRVGFVRMWAWWSLLQPAGPETPIGGPADSNAIAANGGPDGQARIQPNVYKENIDGEIRYLRDNFPDIKVVLTIHRFPPWSNAATRNTPAGQRANNGEDVHYAFPDALDVNSPWAKMIAWFITNYTRTSANTNQYIDALEIVNEPNIQCIPQSTASAANAPSDDPAISTVQCPTSQMMASALVRRDAAYADLQNQFGSSVGPKPVLLAPATGDHYAWEVETNTGVVPRLETTTRTSYVNFTNNLLSLLGATALTMPKDFIWSHHNYHDQSYNYGRDTNRNAASHQCPTVNRAWFTRLLMTNRWTGGPYGDANYPYIFITEGGVDRGSKEGKRVRWVDVWNPNPGDPKPPMTDAQKNAAHGYLMTLMLQRMQNEEDGKGVGMVAQYLNYTSPVTDSGIRNAVTAGGAKRQPAYDNWSAAESYPEVR